MKPNSVLTPPTPEEKLLYKGDFPYRKVVGALLWLQNVRPDISQTVRQLARHCLRYSYPHAEAAIHVLKYVYATRHMNIAYSASRGQFLPIDPAPYHTHQPQNHSVFMAATKDSTESIFFFY